MPGLVIASRRWNIGSDDLILPASLYLFAHLLWITLYIIFSWKNSSIFLDKNCSTYLTFHVFGQLVMMIGFSILEICIIKVSLRGSILNTRPRSSLNTLLYIWFALFSIEIIWEVYGLIIAVCNNNSTSASTNSTVVTIINYNHNNNCAISTKEKIYGLKIFLILIWLSLFFFIWCAFDAAGRSWVKMKRFQESLNNPNSKYKYRRSNSFHRNWRHREAIRKYERSWVNRCRMFCCIKDSRDNYFADIAKLLSDFFRDLDVVPSDVVAGLSLMRVQQKSLRQEKMKNSEQKIFQFLSGAPITSETKFLDLTHLLVIKEVYNLIHYLHYSLAIYGWPMFMMSNRPTKWCQLLNHVKCCGNQSSHWYNCCGGNGSDHCNAGMMDNDNFVNIYKESDNILGDNCCLCNRAAIRQTCIDHDYKIIFITYHVAIEKPPFFVAVDYDKMSIVISIRGTLSLYDVMTDLNAEYDLLPLNPPKENWFGHKGMVSAAAYIRSKLIDKSIIEIANEELKSRNSTNTCHQYPIIIVGHSLGAGTAAILAVLLKEIYNNVICFAFAPPGGLLSEELAEYTKDFVISIVLGKDIIPRLGLHQMEKLRFDLIQSIKHCDMSKWGIIFKSCCIGRKDIPLQDFIKKFKMNWENVRLSSMKINDDEKIKKLSTHPNDESISLTVHTPLYPPGSIIHLVKVHPNKSERIIGKKQYIIQALWASYRDFNEILISPSMIRDHMPDRILQALHSLLINTGPPKPQRIAVNDTNTMMITNKNMDPNKSNSTTPASNNSNYNQTNIIMETSFATGNIETEIYNVERLKRLKSLIKKGRAPLATPETISLVDQQDLSTKNTTPTTTTITNTASTIKETRIDLEN